MNDLDSERSMLPVTEESLKRALKLRFLNSQNVENVKYQLNTAVAEERRT